MGIDWTLYKADPLTYERAEERELGLRPVYMEHIDTLLCGDSHGPLTTCFSKGIILHEELGYSIHAVSADRVRELDQELEMLRRMGFASIERFANDWCSGDSAEDQRSFYEFCKNATERVIRFIREAKESNFAIRLEVSG